jgi:hypothetical protein
MLGMVAPCPLTIALPLHLRQRPGLGVDQRRHPDGNPLLPRAPHPRATMPGALIVQPTLPVGTPRIPWPRAVRVAIACIDRVAQDFHDTALHPPVAVVLTRRDPLEGEALVDGVGAELLLHTPALHLPHHLGLSFIDDPMLRGRRGLADIPLAIRGVAPVDPPVARRKELPTPRAVLHERPLVLGKPSLDLPQHLLLGTVAEGVMDKDDLTNRVTILFTSVRI